MANKERLNKITQIANNEEAAVALFNENVDKVNKAIEDSLSRTNALPNNMKANLDMGDKAIINLKMRPIEKRDDGDVVVWGEIKDFTGASKRAEDAAIRAEGWKNEAKEAADLSSARASDSEDFADLAQAWAVADDFDDRLEGESSSKAYSNLAMAIANAPEDTPVNMSELQSTVILKGDSATLQIANVSTLPAGQEAYFRNIGNERDAVFEIGLPRAQDDVYSQGNLGDIRSTAATTLPKGCSWCDGGWKTQAEYPDMYEAVRTKQVATVTASAYDSQISSNGCCVSFVLDEANKRFRVPTLKNNLMFAAAGDVSAYGTYKAAGLPNITGHFYGGLSMFTYYGDGAFYRDPSVKGNTDPYGDGGNRDVDSFGFSASRSNPIYGNSDTVQPEAVQLNYYVVLSESRKSIYCPKPSVATFADLPMSGNILGDTRVTVDTSFMYVWAQTATGSHTWTFVGSAAGSGGSVLPDNVVINNAEGRSALAIGEGARATGSSEIAFGRGASTVGVIGEPSPYYVSQNIAIGNSAHIPLSTVSGGTPSSNNIAIGPEAGTVSDPSHTGRRVETVAIGYQATASADKAIQLGRGLNSTEGSLQFLDYPLVNSDGKIPVERLPEDIGGAGSLEDIAVAGEGITFTKPVVQNRIASADINGSPTISTEGLLTGLSSSNYLRISENSVKGYGGGRFFREKCNWSVSCKFKTPSTVSKARIFRAGNSVTDSNNYLWCSYSEDGSSGTVSAFVYTGNTYTLSGTTVLELDTWYSVRLSRNITDNTYTLELSKDGEDWHTEASITSSSSLGFNYNYYLYISQVSSSYTALEYDLRGLSVQNDYANVNWTAYFYDDTKTEISTDALLNYGDDDNAVVIKSEDGTERVVADGAVLRAEGVSVALGSSLSYSNYDVVIGNGVSSSGNSANHLSVVIGFDAKSTDFRSVSIGEGTRSAGGVAIGEDANASSASVALYGTAGYGAVSIGKYSNSSGSYSVSMGYNARATASNAIQIGQGANSTSNTMNVGLSDSLNVQLLDADGKIPVERLPDDIGGTTVLEDIAKAGEGITFTTLTSVKDYEVIGSPKISSEGEAKGFSDSDYLTAINPVNAEDSLDSFEILTAIKVDSVPTDNSGIIDVSGSKGDISFRLTTSSSGSIRFRTSTDGATQYPVDITGSTVLETNKKYFVKVTYSSASGYALFSSADGVEWTSEGTSSVLTRPYKSSVETICVGDNVASGAYFEGSIYLRDTYINVNGERAWTAWEGEDKTEVSANVDLTGYLQNTSTDTYSGISIASDYPNSSRGAINIGKTAQATAQGAVAIGGGAGFTNTKATASGQYSTALGSGAIASGKGAIALSGQTNDGYLTQATATGAVAIGSSASASTDNAVAIGSSSKAKSSSSVAIGYGATSEHSMYTTAVGAASTSKGFKSTALGYAAKVEATGSYAIQIGQGTNSTANTMNVGLSDSLNVQLLDANGQIPAERLTNVLGDIETLLAAL